MKSNALFFVLVSLVLCSCVKEQSSKPEEYFKYEVEGEQKEWGPGNMLNSGQFECSYLGDSVLFIAVKFGVEAVGFYIKSDKLKDGTYILDDNNEGLYFSPKDFKKYITNSMATGRLVITEVYYKTYPNTPFLRGRFSFKANAESGEIVNVSSGDFLMELSTH